MLARGDTEIASWRLPDTDEADLATVDALARLQLEARRMGCTISVHGVSRILGGLIRLAGLVDVLVGDSVVEVGGESEDLEQAGVEEVVVADDPAV